LLDICDDLKGGTEHAKCELFAPIWISVSKLRQKKEALAVQFVAGAFRATVLLINRQVEVPLVIILK
jgi:hypothetical protein